MKRLALLVVALLLALVAVVAAAPATPDDCPATGQYLCLTPGHGAYVWCDEGVLEVHPVPGDPELAIVYCELPGSEESRRLGHDYLPVIGR